MTHVMNAVMVTCVYQLSLFILIALQLKRHVSRKQFNANYMQGFQSGPVPGTFIRLRSCIVPAEITEPPKILPKPPSPQN
jgi:hypothetical protein